MTTNTDINKLTTEQLQGLLDGANSKSSNFIEIRRESFVEIAGDLLRLKLENELLKKECLWNASILDHNRNCYYGRRIEPSFLDSFNAIVNKVLYE